MELTCGGDGVGQSAALGLLRNAAVYPESPIISLLWSGAFGLCCAKTCPGYLHLLEGYSVPIEYTLLYSLAVIIGLRAIWIGIRGLRGQETVRYHWPLSRLVSEQSVDERDAATRLVLRAGSTLRLFFGLLLVGLGAFGLWAGYLR